MPLFSCNPTEKSLYIHDGNAMPLVLQELNLSKCMYICKKNVYKKQIVILVLNICVDYGMHNIFLTYMHTQCKRKKSTSQVNIVETGLMVPKKDNIFFESHRLYDDN
jgi:uncharacterized membrane protein YwzB